MGYFVYFCGLFLEKSTYFQKQPITFLNKRTFSKNPVDVKKSRENCGQYTNNMVKIVLSYKKKTRILPGLVWISIFQSWYLQTRSLIHGPAGFRRNRYLQGLSWQLRSRSWAVFQICQGYSKLLFVFCWSVPFFKINVTFTVICFSPWDIVFQTKNSPFVEKCLILIELRNEWKTKLTYYNHIYISV